MNVRLMRLAEHEGTAISDALGDDLWKLLKLDIEPPPVLFRPIKGGWGGTTPMEDETSFGEIVLNENLLNENRTVQVAIAKKQLVQVYLHEWAHRLTENLSESTRYPHDAIFATVNLALLVRANPGYHLLAHTGLGLYDFQDHINRAHDVNLADAAAFVMQHGVELGDSDVPVSGLAAEAKARFERFKSERTARPQREDALFNQVQDLKQRLQSANQLKHFALVGLFIASALAVLGLIH